MRQARVERNTKETRIAAEVNLDGSGTYDVATGIGFLDHMLEQFSRHSLIDLTVRAEGDLHIDFHHTTEDTGITRYGAALVPLDEALSRAVVDCSNRPYLIWNVTFTAPKLGEMDTELFREWFQAFAQAAGLTLHMESLYGENSHHIVESLYKGLARALRQAISIDAGAPGSVPSTKGVLSDAN